MTWTSAAVLVCALFLSGASVQADDNAAKPDRLDVRAFGAVGDGKTDDTQAFQAALDAAGAAGGGIVIAPRGDWRIATHLSIPSNVTLEGVFTVPPAWGQGKGTTLYAEEGAGSEDGPAFISLGTNSALKGVTVFYPGQDDPTNLKPYPWCVATRGGDNSSIVDCLLVNPYNAVDFGTHPSGRHYIRNLYGQPLRRGIFVDQCYDVGRIENVHFWPFWDWKGPEIQKWMAENGEPFIFGRTDWEYVLNTFVFGYRIGYHFIATPSGACNGNFLGIGADCTANAVVVDECQGMGLLITNGEFVSMVGPEPISVLVGERCTGDVTFSNCAFWGPSQELLRHRGSGTVTLQACNFRDWDCRGEGRPALEALSGQLIVQGCNFTKSAPHIALGPAVTAATVVGNRFPSEAVIQNSSLGSVQIGLNAETSIREAEVSLGATDRGTFLSQFDGGDGRTDAGERDGVSYRISGGMYLYLAASPALAANGKHPAVGVEVTYLDEGQGAFFLEYDSLDAAVLKVPERPGAFKATDPVALAGTGQWKVATFHLTDARFAGRCNGGDLRIVTPEQPVAVSKVRVWRETAEGGTPGVR